MIEDMRPKLSMGLGWLFITECGVITYHDYVSLFWSAVGEMLTKVGCVNIMTMIQGMF
jgi:hypothetical protein